MTTDEQQLPRKLAAILYADVAGYSRLTGEDEEGTHRQLSAHLDLIEEQVAAHNGSVIHYAGDAVLAEFATVTDALLCAARVQQHFEDKNEALAEERRVRFRIGVNLGEVIVDRGDIYGDGVNVAARLEGLAEPGGVCVSGTVHDAIGSKLPLDFRFLGEQTVKNIAKPVRAFSVTIREGESLPEPVRRARAGGGMTKPAIGALVIAVAVGAGLLAWMKPWQPDQATVPTQITESSLTTDGESGNGLRKKTLSASGKPSIAVLPFTNMSDDPEQEYFSDGISEDIITDLSQLSNLSVIARQSSFSYKGTATKVQQIGEDLGVGYLLEGSVRKAGNRVRITAQLIDASSGHHVWAERYDRELVDIFALQDEIKQRIVSELAVQLSDDENRGERSGTTNNFEAYDLFLQGRRHFSKQTSEGFEQATDSYRQAIALDPEFARAYGALAITLTRQVMIGVSDSPVESAERAVELAKKAVAIDPMSAQTQWALGFAYLHQRQHEASREAAVRSVALAPNYADGYALLALINNYFGRGEEALKWITKATDLNPHHSWDYPYNAGRAYYTLGEYEKSVEVLQDALERNELNYLPRLWLAASFVRLGQQDDAEWEVAQIEMVAPNFTLSHLAATLPMRDNELKNRLLDDLRTAGLPE
jgi:adenylate cyclase